MQLMGMILAKPQWNFDQSWIVKYSINFMEFNPIMVTTHLNRCNFILLKANEIFS
jgi:hypothetical protein